MESLSGDLTGGTEESNVNIEIAGLRANILNEAILSTKWPHIVYNNIILIINSCIISVSHSLYKYFPESGRPVPVVISRYVAAYTKVLLY